MKDTVESQEGRDSNMQLRLIKSSKNGDNIGWSVPKSVERKPQQQWPCADDDGMDGKMEILVGLIKSQNCSPA
jgi:hypothetical protein